MKTITDDLIRELCIICTQNEAGRHFTEWTNWEALEEAGLIEIDRPTHIATGLPCPLDLWTVEVTPEGQDLVDWREDLHPAVE